MFHAYIYRKKIVHLIGCFKILVEYTRCLNISISLSNQTHIRTCLDNRAGKSRHANVAKSTNRDHLPLRDFIINARGTRTVGVQCVHTIISDIRVSINVEEKPLSDLPTRWIYGELLINVWTELLVRFMERYARYWFFFNNFLPL